MEVEPGGQPPPSPEVQIESVYEPLTPERVRWYYYKDAYSLKGMTAQQRCPSSLSHLAPAPPAAPLAWRHWRRRLTALAVCCCCAGVARAPEIPHRSSLLRFCDSDNAALEAAYRQAAAGAAVPSLRRVLVGAIVCL